MGALVWVDSDDHDRPSFLRLGGRPRSTCRLPEPEGIMPLLSQTAAGHRPDDTPRQSQPSEAAGGSRVTPADDLRNATGFSLAAYRWAYDKSAVQLSSDFAAGNARSIVSILPGRDRSDRSGGKTRPEGRER